MAIKPRRKAEEWSTHARAGTANKILVGNSKWKTPLRRTRHRWQENIKVYMMYEDVTGIHTAETRSMSGLWWTRSLIEWFHKRRRISRFTEKLSPLSRRILLHTVCSGKAPDCFRILADRRTDNDWRTNG
jgi:hypothetical protein